MFVNGVSNLKGEGVVGTFYKKELQKTNQVLIHQNLLKRLI